MSSLRWLTEPHRSRSFAAAIAAGLFALGAGLLGVAAADQHHAPQPPRSAAGTTGPVGGPIVPEASPQPDDATSTSTPGPAALASPPTLGPSTPTAIAIPAIGVRSELITVGLNADQTMQVPLPGPDYGKAAWYKYSPAPGQIGPSIIEGHVDSVADGPSVFYRLGALRPGDTVEVTRADHVIVVFRIDGVQAYPKSGFPADTVYGNTEHPALRLITCGGSFDRTGGHYTDNIIAFATLASQRPAP